MKWVYQVTQQRSHWSRLQILSPLVPHSLGTKSQLLSFYHILKSCLLSAYFNKAQEPSFWLAFRPFPTTPPFSQLLGKIYRQVQGQVKLLMLIPTWLAAATVVCISLQRYGLCTFTTETQRSHPPRCSIRFWTAFLHVPHDLSPLWLPNRVLPRIKCGKKWNKAEEFL